MNPKGVDARAEKYRQYSSPGRRLSRDSDEMLVDNHFLNILGELDTSELHFSIPELVAHAAFTRPLAAGTVIGTGTVSNDDSASRGVACLVERRMIETIERGKPETPFLGFGDEITIETLAQRRSLFGKIVNRIVPVKG